MKKKWISCKQIGYPGIGIIFQNGMVRVMLFFVDILIVVPQLTKRKDRDTKGKPHENS